EKESISLVEQSGIPQEDLEAFANIPCTPGCAEFSVIRTGEYFACNDIQNDLYVPGLKSFAKKRGINSCMILPIKKSGNVIGTFNLYSTQLNFSSTSEVRLLREVTDDISFALDLFEKARKYEEATQQILKHEQKFRHTLDNLLEGIQIHDFNFRYLYVNDVLVKSSGYTREELIGFTLMEKYPGIEHSDLYKSLQRCLDERVPEHLSTTFTFPDGSQTDFELSIEPIPEGVSILSIDRTDQNKAQEKLLKANRLYAFISAINQSIVHITDQQELLNNVCRIAVEIGQYKMAWIDLIDEETGKLNIVSLSGTNDATQAAQKFSGMGWNDPILLGTPTGIALSTGRLGVINDLENDPAMAPWKKEISANGIKSGMALPIKKSGKLVGVFGFYSAVKNHFDDDETALLEEATDDICFALEIFEKERKHRATEHLVIRNEKRFRALVEQGTDGVAIFSSTGSILYVSPSIERMLGYTEEEALKLDMFALVHPDDLGGLGAVWEKVMTSPGIPVKGYTGRLLHKDGSWRWLEATATNMLHDSSINGIVDNFRDVTEEMKLAAQQEFEKDNLDALINNTTDLMWSVDRNYNLITSNKPFENISIINFGRVIAKGESVLSVSHTPEMLENFRKIYERAFAGETFTETAYFDIPFEFWSEISYYPIRHGEEIIGTACHSRDVTHTKLAERQLLKSESRLKEAQAMSQIGNWELDFAHGTHTWSDGLYTILGIEKGDAPASMEFFLSFMHPEDADEIKTKVDEAFISLKATSYNFRFIRKDGTVRYGYTERKFEFDKNNKPTRLLGVVQDITDRKLIEEERDKMISSIIQHSQNLEQFTSIVSHNLRAPVANILGLSHVLKNDLS
ncbi:MAG TPA: PAS domain S-box protein, partial [Bacteroidia bacterium]|nr:PAS domain S-box protein [Bacteroidia bacterium]